MKTFAIILSVAVVVGTVASASAQTTTDLNNQATQMNTLAASQGQTKVTNKISGDFNSFLGSDSGAVVSGLRNGTQINLTRTETTTSAATGLPVTTTTTTTITPPTGPMGNGEVYIALALAKQQLGAMGITEPTPEQLQAALTGGQITQTTAAGTTTTQMQGILTMRSQKMGWGKIAQELDTKLGPVISGMKRANQSLTTSTTAKGNSSTASTTAATAKGKGVTSASGRVTGSSNRHIVTGSGKVDKTVGHGASTGKGSGSGIVTASGHSGGGHAYGRSSGIVTGSGRSGGYAGGTVSARGNGAANGKGHNK